MNLQEAADLIYGPGRVTATLDGDVEVHDVDGQKVLVVEIPPNVQVQVRLTMRQVERMRAALWPADA